MDETDAKKSIDTARPAHEGRRVSEAMGPGVALLQGKGGGQLQGHPGIHQHLGVSPTTSTRVGAICASAKEAQDPGRGVKTTPEYRKAGALNKAGIENRE